MEMITAKSEMGPGRRRLCMAEGDNIETKCIKRRRRDPSTGSLGCYNQQGEQQQQQGDQPTATTVKRSSRFRGVSRFYIISWFWCYMLIMLSISRERG